MENNTILVIEDDKLNMKLMRVLLALDNYNILEAVDAEIGIRLAHEHRPDLILMDIQLPGMNGFDATRIIKDDPALKDIPVIIVTSCAMQGDDQKARDAGSDDYVTKPIDTRLFLKTIARCLKLRRDS